MPLNELLPKAMKLFPEREAIACGGVRMTYREFASRTWRLCRVLEGMKLAQGDRMAIIHENCHVYLETYFAAAHRRLILVPLNHRLSPGELAAILKDCSATVLIAQQSFRDKVQALRDTVPGLRKILWTGSAAPENGITADSLYENLISLQDDSMPAEMPVKEDDVAHLYYTSGTTGRAKGVMLTHRNVKSHALGTIAELGLSDRDHWFHVAPLFHLADAWATFAITWAGGKHVIIPSFDAGKVLELLQKERITLTNLIPTMLNLMVNHPDAGKFDYSSLRVIMSGGAPIAPEVVKKIIDTFRCDYIQTYGMTETSPYLTLSILKEHLKSLPYDEQMAYKASTGREFIECLSEGRG